MKFKMGKLVIVTGGSPEDRGSLWAVTGYVVSEHGGDVLVSYALPRQPLIAQWFHAETGIRRQDRDAHPHRILLEG